MYLFFVIGLLVSITLLFVVIQEKPKVNEGLELNDNDNTKINGKIATNGMDPNDMPPAWNGQGGVRTKDVYAGGWIGAGSDKNTVKAWMSSEGKGFFDNELSVGSEIVRGNETVSGNSTVTGDLNLSATNKLKVNGQIALPPVGSMMAYLGAPTVDPDGWVICDGQPRTNDGKYNVLITLGIGTIESGKYKPPDLTERVLKGVKTQDIKLMSAAPTMTLTEAQMPAHNHAGTSDEMNQNRVHSHGVYDPTHSHDVLMGGGRDDSNFSSNNGQYPLGDAGGANYRSVYTAPVHTGIGIYETNINHLHTFTTNTKGSGAIINLPPPLSYGVKYIVKY